MDGTVDLPDLSPEEPHGDFERRLAAVKARDSASSSTKAPDDSMGLAARSGVEFVAAIGVAVLLGVGIDKVLGSSPAGLLVMIVLGFAAGLLNIYRATKGMGYGETYRKPEAKPGKQDDEAGS
jgi:ATP synthase protein I